MARGVALKAIAIAKTKIGDVETDFGDRILDNAGIFPRAV